MVPSIVSRLARTLAGASLLLGCGASANPDEADHPVSASSPEADASGSASSSLQGNAAGRSSRRSGQPALLTGDAGPRWTVLSFNINFGTGHDPENAAVIAETDADLVLLQETTDHSERAFREALADRYPHVLFEQCCNAGGLGVLSKHPIVQDDYLQPAVGWFPAWRVVVDGPLGRVQVLNVHLRPPMSDGGSWAAGYFTTRGVRRDEIEDFWRRLDPELPTVVAGDFNENAQGRAIAFLAEQGLQSALPLVKPRAKTWEWQTRAGKLRAMLDHVVFDSSLGLAEAEVLERGNSDHFPVLAVLGASR